MFALTRPLAVLLVVVGLAVLPACDAGPEDTSSFARLQGAWERTDRGFEGETVRFGPGQDYEFRNDDGTVETGAYVTLSGTESEDITVRYMGEEARPDEAALLTEGTLMLTPPDGEARRYRRD